MTRLLQPHPVHPNTPVAEIEDLLHHAHSPEGHAVLLHAAFTAPAAALRPTTPLGEAEDDDEDPTVAVVATSGSTGSPKGVLLQASALASATEATAHALGGAGQWLLTLPTHYVAGLAVVLRGIRDGVSAQNMDLSEGFRVQEFVRASSALPGHPTTGRRYTALVPTQLQRILDAGPDGQKALATFDRILVGGAPLPEALHRRALDAGVALVRTYGMSETCGGVVYEGAALPGVQLRLEPEAETAPGTGQPAQAGPGSELHQRILLGGAMVARGYRCEPQRTARDFVLREGKRFFRTSDHGSLHGGRLHVSGRLDSVLISGGIKVAPEDVARAALRLPGIAAAHAFGVDDAEWGQRVVLAVVPQPGHTPLELAELRAVLSDDLPAAALPRQLITLAALPTLASGKPDPVALASLAHAN